MQKDLGYYSCNGIDFDTKLKAMMYANETNLPIGWHFNDEVYNTYNWSVEPGASLDTLYDLRARQLREKYDYIILNYSGGADSNNILESFLRQGLFVDEIITNWALDATDKYLVHSKEEKSPWNTNAEFELHTKHRLEYIKNKSPNTKITVIDSSKMILDGLITAGDGSWVQEKNDVFNVTGALQYNPVYFNDIRKRFDTKTSIAYVIGIDKPKLILQNNSLYLYFIDKITGIVPAQDHLKQYNNTTIEFFYWSPETCDLICKQAHTVLKYLKAFPQHQSVWATTDIHALRRTQEQLLRTIVYTTWNPEWFQVNKTINDWDCEFDMWFTRGLSGTKEHSIWLDGLKFITPKISNFIKYNSSGEIYGTKPYFSKYHYIGNIYDSI
jgi:hypothetical protein